MAFLCLERHGQRAIIVSPIECWNLAYLMEAIDNPMPVPSVPKLARELGNPWWGKLLGSPPWRARRHDMKKSLSTLAKRVAQLSPRAS